MHELLHAIRPGSRIPDVFRWEPRGHDPRDHIGRLFSIQGFDYSGARDWTTIGWYVFTILPSKETGYDPRNHTPGGFTAVRYPYKEMTI